MSERGKADNQQRAMSMSDEEIGGLDCPKKNVASGRGGKQREEEADNAPQQPSKSG